MKRILLPLLCLSCFAFGEDVPNEVFVINPVRNVITTQAVGETNLVAITSPLESNGAVPINVQDQTSRTGDIHFSQVISGSVTSTLAQATSIDDYTVEVSSGHGITNTDQLVIFDTVSSRLYIGDVLSVATDTITLDTPINFAYPTNTTAVLRSTYELDVDGSSTRQIFSIIPPINLEIDVTRIMFEIICTDPPEMLDFGDIANGLTRGLVMRASNGINVNYYNVKDNGDMTGLMHDIRFYAQTGPQGVNGVYGRLTYGGQEKHGAVIRLGQDESLDLIIQDNLTSLVRFRATATFHVVED